MKRHRTFTHIAFADSLDSVYTVFFKSMLILSLVILTAPVIQGCHKHEHPQDSGFTEVPQKSSVKLAVRQSEGIQIRSVDAFVFNDDALQRIDCYQKCNGLTDGQILVGSSSGKKIVLLCANAPWSKKDWEDVSSYTKASSVRMGLEDEDREYPTMSATTHITAGGKEGITLERLTSEVALKSIQCDFSGKPYEGEEITDAKVYLININATCRLTPTDNEPIERIINHGNLIQEDMNKFKSLNFVFSNLGTIKLTHTYPDVRFLCYPNTSTEESIGTPFTRLVVEGKIQGETWYWPININRNKETDHEGIIRNRRYNYDITIRSKGTKDPDTPIIPEMAETIFTIEKWKEKNPYQVSF